MGNYTEIEKEFNLLFGSEVDKVIAEGKENKLSDQLIRDSINRKRVSTLAQMRKDKMKELSDYTGRNVICYSSSWLQSSQSNIDLLINDNDTNGFMNAVAGLDR